MWMDDNWRPYPAAELAGFLDNINPIDGKYRVSRDKTMAEIRELPFYESVELIRVKDPDWINRSLFIYYLSDDGNLFRLNGTSPPLHEVNGKSPDPPDRTECPDLSAVFFCSSCAEKRGRSRWCRPWRIHTCRK